ncbi:hypothetical protein [Pseudomonas petrae]|uniref:hypothetical protein n=1 Tax=Pseudomonas petrae TaxID=2912190 RepID=UPI001EF0527C|nr:hypothetical protein [Pseudomonas petrae]MCF7535373.1 hypothetical protein [Pseudomonas petrae]MCF7558690.1 hypothetical protein [Pseudomonas petrae]
MKDTLFAAALEKDAIVNPVIEPVTTVMQNVFSQTTFDRMSRDLKSRYESSIQMPHSQHKGAIVEVQVEGLQAAADEYHRLLSAGYAKLPDTSPLNSFNMLGNANGVYLVQISLLKTPEQQAADLEVMYADLKSQYLADIEEAQRKEEDRQVEIALTAAARKEAEKQQAAQKALADRVRAEMQDSRNKLRTTLIAKGKLNENGEAA